MDKPAQWALVGAAWFLALSVALFGYLAWQSVESRLSHAAIPGQAAARAQVQDPPAATGAAGLAAPGSDAGTAVCPVTGERVPIGPDTPQVNYLGKTYYFSSDKDAQGEDARTRFLMNPDAWLKGRGADAP